jgi:hypothetical protein
MMVIDETKGLGWFVSDRHQPEGKVCVYLFIPNESRRHITEIEDNEQLRARAALTSIRETWREGYSYAEQIHQAKTNLSSMQQRAGKDFEFIINERTTYHTWGEFRSAEARLIYERVIHLKQRIEVLENNLEEQRQTYSNENRANRDRLKPSILQGEAELKYLFSQIGEWEKRARNTENTSMRN